MIKHISEKLILFTEEDKKGFVIHELTEEVRRQYVKRDEKGCIKVTVFFTVLAILLFPFSFTMGVLIGVLPLLMIAIVPYQYYLMKDKRGYFLSIEVIEKMEPEIVRLTSSGGEVLEKGFNRMLVRDVETGYTAIVYPERNSWFDAVEGETMNVVIFDDTHYYG